MNWNLLLPLLITTFVAIGGWLAVHSLTMRRDRESKRRELIIQYLLEAYRRLKRAAIDSSHDTTYDADQFIRDVESSISDIQLFGTRKQIELIREFTDNFNKEFINSENMEMDKWAMSLRKQVQWGLSGIGEVLADLRKELRKELGLESVADVLWLILYPQDLEADSDMLLNEKPQHNNGMHPTPHHEASHES